MKLFLEPVAFVTFNTLNLTVLDSGRHSPIVTTSPISTSLKQQKRKISTHFQRQIVKYKFTWSKVINEQTYSCVSSQNGCIFECNEDNRGGSQWFSASSSFGQLQSGCVHEWKHYRWMDISCQCKSHQRPINRNK